MDPELMQELRHCTAAVNDLLDQMETDDAGISSCVGGEILTEYRRGLDEAKRIANSLKASLRLLQAEG